MVLKQDVSNDDNSCVVHLFEAAMNLVPYCSNLTVRSYYTHYASLAVLVYLTKRALDRTRNCIGYGTRLNNILQHGTKYSTIQLISDT